MVQLIMSLPILVHEVFANYIRAALASESNWANQIHQILRSRTNGEGTELGDLEFLNSYNNNDNKVFNPK
jgi:hypothetical protein